MRTPILPYDPLKTFQSTTVHLPQEMLLILTSLGM